MEESNVREYQQVNQQEQEREHEEGLRRETEKVKTPADKMKDVPKNTLDQGICSSLGSELKGICVKFSYVLIPREHGDSGGYLRNWDLWGPFLMCLIFAFFIDNSDAFMFLFFSVFIGAVLVTFNIRVLGGGVSFFQSVAILGYCLCPMFIALLLLELFKFLQIKSGLLRLILIILSVVWSIFAARSFVAVNVPQGKKFVALYPIILFYLFIGLIMIFH